MATWVTGARTINCYTDKDVTWYSLMRVTHSAACLALATYVKVKAKASHPYSFARLANSISCDLRLMSFY